MDTFSPEFSQYWQQDHGVVSSGPLAVKGDDDATQQAALEELAERVSAARSVV